MPVAYAGNARGSVVTEPRLGLGSRVFGGHRSIPVGVHLYTAFRRHEAATARVVRRKPMKRTRG